MSKENKIKATCNNCGCPDMEERHDHLWCDWCSNEQSIDEDKTLNISWRL